LQSADVSMAANLVREVRKPGNPNSAGTADVSIRRRTWRRIFPTDVRFWSILLRKSAGSTLSPGLSSQKMARSVFAADLRGRRQRVSTDA
jgi:hypothetical protein